MQKAELLMLCMLNFLFLIYLLDITINSEHSAGFYFLFSSKSYRIKKLQLEILVIDHLADPVVFVAVTSKIHSCNHQLFGWIRPALWPFPVSFNPAFLLSSAVVVVAFPARSRLWVLSSISAVILGQLVARSLVIQWLYVNKWATRWNFDSSCGSPLCGQISKCMKGNIVTMSSCLSDLLFAETMVMHRRNLWMKTKRNHSIFQVKKQSVT